MHSLPTLKFEQDLWNQGKSLIAGIDEVGRGSWAGPVVAAAVVFNPLTINDVISKTKLKLVNDSKKVIPNLRTELSELIKATALHWSIGEISIEKINEEGIGKATQLAYVEAVSKLDSNPDHILMDAFYIKDLPKNIQTPIIRGDSISLSIAAASIIAKVYRDELMIELHKSFPDYSLNRNKGYGTKEHQTAIRKVGLSKIHRTNYQFKCLNF